MLQFVNRSLFLLQLILLSPVFCQNQSSCNPSNSLADSKVITIRNTSCYFPFIFNNVMYDDCIPYQDGKSKFCATTCNLNRDHEFQLCQWEKANILDQSCANLTTAKQSREPPTNTGQQCMFPFVYKGKCHRDCISMDSNQQWCGITQSVDLNPTRYVICDYNLTALATPGCENLTLASRSQNPENTGSGDLCVFPFLYKGKCYNDCIDNEERDYWCSFSKSYHINRWSFCKYLRAVDKFENGLTYGIYSISANCSHSDMCRGEIISDNQEPGASVFVTKSSSKFPIVTWEIIPQPNNSVIIRVPKTCFSATLPQTAWTFSTSGQLILDSLTRFKLNTRFVLNQYSNSSKLFSLIPIIDNISDPSGFVGFKTSSSDQRESIPLEKFIFPMYWRFELIKKLNIDEMITECNTTTTTVGPTITTGTKAKNGEDYQILYSQINSLQIVIYVTIALCVITLIVVAGMVVMSCRNRS